MDFTTRYGKLNAAQKEAVDSIDGPVMVIAGPGTGKTELLSMRAANILQKTDTLPENILCLTFTDSGANAMRERLSEIIGADAYKVAIHTFHSFGTETINQNGEFFYHGANFRPADELSCYELLRSIFDQLDYNNPLASKMNGEYTHLGDTLTAISELKKSGLTSDELLTVLDANDVVIESIGPQLADVFAGRISKATIQQLAELTDVIRQKIEPVNLPGIVPLAKILADSLLAAVDGATEASSTKPITAWRNAWMKKNEAGEFALKASDRQAKLRAVSYVYYQYLARMQEAELYDFDDMILRVVHAMEVFPELRFNLQERFQYIMVDEFQDTNMAQMRILFNLTNSEINAGRPNILVVGDDDQAIYSFQGADVGNINSFRDLYEQTKLITLTDNYRSAAGILEHARDVITQGQNRLENHIEELNKTLTPHRRPAKSAVSLIELPTASDERAWLATTVASSIQQGTAPNTIAVIARRHHELEALLPYFAERGIAVNYERRDDVLELDVIKLVEHIAAILVALFEKRHDSADALLPELLAHPAFAIPPIDVWRLSLTAQKNRQNWMEVMSVTPQFVPLHAWLVEQSQALAHAPLEIMLDRIIGLPPDRRIVSEEYDDNGDTLPLSSRSSSLLQETKGEEQPKSSLAITQGTLGAERSPGGSEGEEAIAEGDKQGTAFTSPLFNFFFSQEKLERTPDLYLTYLEALRTIRTKLRDYQPNETPTLQSFLEFIRLHRQLGSPITSIRPGSEKMTGAINLMTAHKSKGLEFDNVYVIGAIDNAWGERVRSRSRLIGYPENLPLAPSGDTLDERLRLFFVAMTRAKNNLTVSYSTSDGGSKSTLRASFLHDGRWNVAPVTPHTTMSDLVRAAELAWYQPLVQPLDGNMRQLLAPTLEHYKLSSTHLNTFLDVTRGGPQAFLLGNLLRFPQSMSPSAGYGSAIHATLQRAHAHFSATGKARPLEDILHDFEENLLAARLDSNEFAAHLQKGSDALTRFFDEKQGSFTTTQKAELNFAHQNVRLGEAHLTGSLDLVDIDDDSIIVTDYKTGKALRSWNGKTDYEKTKLHKYRQQLMFYNLLVAHSRDYGKYTFKQGVLQFVEPTPNGDIIALDATFANEDLERFTRLIGVVWHHITTLDLPDTSQYEPSYKGMLAFEDDLLNESLDIDETSK